MMLEPGYTIDGKYRIVRMLGRGGMGAVYEGEHESIHRRVAIKVLHSDVAAKADVVRRFEREAQAAGRIGSEHIVEVFDLGTLPTGERYMIMEFLVGETLGDRLRRCERLEATDIAPIAAQMLEGLTGAHDAGIIHRDLKPDNIFLVRKPGAPEFVKLLDFGVSKFTAFEGESLSMTRTGAVMGTPYYMSPEQARGAKIDGRSDLYSVGVVVYQAVAGRLPFDAATFNELVFKIALESPPPLESIAVGVDPFFAAIVGKAMARDADARFQSAREFHAAVTDWLGGSQRRVVDRTVALPGGPFGPNHFDALDRRAPHTSPSAPSFSAPAGVLTTPQPSPSNAGFAFAPSSPGTPATPPGPPPRRLEQPLAASQAGLSITNPQLGRGGLVLAATVGLLVLAIGGGVAVKLVRDRSKNASSPVAAVEASAEPPRVPAASARPPEAALAPPAPSVVPSVEPSAVASTVPEKPMATTAATTHKPTMPPRPRVPVPAKTTVAPPKPTGRVIGSEL